VCVCVWHGVMWCVAMRCSVVCCSVVKFGVAWCLIWYNVLWNDVECNFMQCGVLRSLISHNYKYLTIIPTHFSRSHFLLLLNIARAYNRLSLTRTGQGSKTRRRSPPLKGP
jgi:hypothetical protein